MNRPPLYLIESFLVFAKSANMVRAAEHLGLSQPALSTHLKLFEEHFTQEVFDQIGRKKVLTPFGQRLKDLLDSRFLHLHEDLKSLSDLNSRPEDIVLRIAGRGELLTHIAAKMHFPGRMIFIDQTGAEAAQGVLHRQYDLAISNHTSQVESLHAKKIFTDHFALLAPKKWIDTKRHLSASLIESLLERPFLSYKETDSSLTELLKTYNFDHKIEPYRVIGNWPSLITMVEIGLGWTIAPILYSHGKSTASLPIPTDLVAGVQFYVIHHKDLVAAPWFRELLEDIRKAVASPVL